MVSNDLLYFPHEVLSELERHDEKSDVANTWAKQNAAVYPLVKTEWERTYILAVSELFDHLVKIAP